MTELEAFRKVFNAVRKKDVYTKEADLLTDTRSFLELLPCTLGVRIDAGSERGKSDILVCYRGRFIAIELKDDIGVPSAQQIDFINKVKQAGGIADICRNLNDVAALLLKTFT